MFPYFSRRQFLYGAVSAAIASVLHSCTSNSSQPADSTSPIPMRFGINPWPGAMPFKVAEAQQLFQANGLEMELTLFPSISNMMDAFNAGQVDATLIDPGTLLISAANGVNQKFVMVTDFSSGADAVVVAPSIKTLADLRGKTISVEMGSIGHLLLLTALEEADIAVDDVTLVNQTADAALAGFIAGKTDVAVSYEPFISQATKQGKGRSIYSTKEAEIAPDVLSVRQDFIDRYPEGVSRLIKTWYDTLQYRETNLEASVAIEADALGVTPDEFKTFSYGVRLVTDPNEAMNYLKLGQSGATLENTATLVSSFLLEQNLLDQEPPAIASLIEGRFITEYATQSA